METKKENPVLPFALLTVCTCVISLIPSFLLTRYVEMSFLMDTSFYLPIGGDALWIFTGIAILIKIFRKYLNDQRLITAIVGGLMIPYFFWHFTGN